MMSLTFGLFNQVSGLGPLGPLVCDCFGRKKFCLITEEIWYQSTSLYQRIKFGDFFLFSLHFISCYLKLLLAQSKFSGTRKFTLRYQ